jgi:ribosome-dependent ATPase
MLFCTMLINFARGDGVTIFLSTHFMNEAARCGPDLVDACRFLRPARPKSWSANVIVPL